MKEELISFETAKLAKEKEFEVYCDYIYCQYSTDYIYDDDPNHRESHKAGDIQLYDLGGNNNIIDENEFAAPTQSLLQKWLREKHEIDIVINAIKIEGKKFYVPSIFKNDTFFTYRTRNSYEDALERGLQEGLKII